MEDVKTVIDVGCAKYGGDESIPYLREEFNPRFLVGFDPAAENEAYWIEDTFVATFGLAAWTKTGHVYFHEAGLGSHVTERRMGGKRVGCIDLAQMVKSFAPCVVKMDAEAAERVLIPHLIAEDVDKFVQLLWIEWHLPDKEIAALTKGLRCEVALWNR